MTSVFPSETDTDKLETVSSLNWRLFLNVFLSCFLCLKLCQKLRGSHSLRINSIKGKLLTIWARHEHSFYDLFFCFYHLKCQSKMHFRCCIFDAVFLFFQQVFRLNEWDCEWGIWVIVFFFFLSEISSEMLMLSCLETYSFLMTLSEWDSALAETLCKSFFFFEV